MLCGDGLERPYFNQYEDDPHLGRVFRYLLRLWIKLMQSCFGFRGNFDALCNWARQTGQYDTLSRPSLSSEVTAVEVEWVSDTTPASFNATISPCPYVRL